MPTKTEAPPSAAEQKEAASRMFNLNIGVSPKGPWLDAWVTVGDTLDVIATAFRKAGIEPTADAVAAAAGLVMAEHARLIDERDRRLAEADE